MILLSRNIIWKIFFYLIEGCFIFCIICYIFFYIDYEKPRKQPKWLSIGKVALVCLITFFGAAFAIMTFNNDVGVNDVFKEIYALVMGEESNGFLQRRYSRRLIRLSLIKSALTQTSLPLLYFFLVY